MDLVNGLESEIRQGRQRRLADYLTRLDFIVLDELGYLPFAQAGGQLLFHLVVIVNVEAIADELVTFAKRWSRKPARRSKSN